MTFRRLAAAAVVLAALAASAFAGPGDPLEPLRGDLAHQDQLAEQGKLDVLITEARTKARDGTPESLYLLGRALGNTAVVRRAQGRDAEFRSLLDEAQRCYEDAKESGLVAFAPAHLGIARCCRVRGDLAGAETNLRQALKMAPAFRAATIDLAQILAEAKRPDDAEFVLLQAFEKRPDDLEVRVLLGMIKMARHRAEEAEPHFRAVVKAQPDNPMGRKLLGGVLVELRRFPEAAEHLDVCRRLMPKDEEVYRVLFVARMKSKDRTGAAKVLADARRDVPGTPTAVWAEQVAEEYRKDPSAFEEADEKSPQALARKLESADPAVVVGALTDMRAYEWKALPAVVYRLLAPKTATPPVRRAAVQLIGAQKDPRTITLLEILLFHPRETDPDAGVRRDTAEAVASLPTPGIVPILMRALDDGDPAVREAAVRGIATQTGKYFRADLAVPTAPENWAAERQAYDRWWRGSAAGSVAKRDACTALGPLFEPISQGRRRLAEYTLAAIDDGDARTWRAGYDLFRSLTKQDFGSAVGEPEAAERARITQVCRQWFAANGNQEQ